MLDVYHNLHTECSNLDSYFKFAFLLNCCIILEMVINALMTQNKLSEEIDIFEKNLIGIFNILFLLGILISWFFIYLNYDQQCFSKIKEYSSIREFIYQYPANKIISYYYNHFGVFNSLNFYFYFKHVLSRSEQGQVSRKLTEENICIISLQEFKIGEQFIILKCHKDHVYHKGCILDWFDKILLIFKNNIPSPKRQL